MSTAYQAGVKEHCRNAQVVFDKFHIIAQVGKAVEQVRRAELCSGRKGAWDSLNKTQWLWRKNPENLSPQEQERWGRLIRDKNLVTAKAYQMRLVLQGIYQSPTASDARGRLKVWCRWVRWVGRYYKSSLFGSMIRAAQMIQNHLAGILAHWKWGLTNAFMEGLISVFSAVKRKARGYRSTTYLIAMLYLVAAKLRLLT